MRCARIPGGFVCGSKPITKSCVHCGKRATLACDWKLIRRGKDATCDAPLCDNCTHSPARDKDLCQAHAETWKHHPANQENNHERSRR